MHGRSARGGDVDVLTLGQYLRPTANHLPVQRFVEPEQFEQYRQWGLERGFRECVAGPLVRSSYRAERVLAGNNVGLQLRTERAEQCGRDRGRRQSGWPSQPMQSSLARPLAYEPTWRAMQRYTEERGPDSRRSDLAARARAGVHAGHECRCLACARAGRYSGGADRPRRPGDLSRARPAGGLSADRHAARRSRCGDLVQRARAQRDRVRRAIRYRGPMPRRCARASTSMGASSPAWDCASDAAAAITGWRSMCAWIWSRLRASIPAATADCR